MFPAFTVVRDDENVDNWCGLTESLVYKVMSHQLPLWPPGSEAVPLKVGLPGLQNMQTLADHKALVLWQYHIVAVHGMIQIGTRCLICVTRFSKKFLHCMYMAVE